MKSWIVLLIKASLFDDRTLIPADFATDSSLNAGSLVRFPLFFSWVPPRSVVTLVAPQVFMQIYRRYSSKRIEHGGVLTYGKRNSRRSVIIGKPVHLVLRSDKAVGRRSFLKNDRIVRTVLAKFSKRFGIKIYQLAICGNHIHCLAKAYNRKDLQNFFRVFAGQVAQEILRKHPMQKWERKAFRGGTHKKNQKTFWSFLLYSRVVSWGRDFGNVKRYIVRNVLEAFGVIAYQARPSRFPLGRYPGQMNSS